MKLLFKISKDKEITPILLVMIIAREDGVGLAFVGIHLGWSVCQL